MRVRPSFVDQCELQVWLSEEASDYQLHVQRDGTVHTRCPCRPTCATCQGPDNWPFVFNQARLACAFPSQVVSFGPLGVLGRNGWFCREADVDRWNALAGFRGLRDPQVRQHFNGTFIAFEAEGWGPNQALIENLDLRYDAIYLGADLAPHAIQKRGSRPGFLHSSTYGRRIRLTARTASTGSNFLHTPRSSSTKAFPTIRRTCWRK